MDNIENMSTIEYEYKIDPNEAARTGNMDSNVTTTALILGELTMTKSVDKEYATIGDVVTYTINVNNTGNILTTNIQFKDIIPAGLEFVSGSVTVNSTSQPTYDPNVGFSLGALIILGSSTVVFKAEVVSLPPSNVAINKATTTFDYLVILPVGGNAESNSVTTNINVSELSITKVASVDSVAPGDTLTYTITIKNNGNIPAGDVNFIDPIASELTFVTGSVTIDSVSQPTYDPNVGFSLGNIPAGDTVTIIFDTTVN